MIRRSSQRRSRPLFSLFVKKTLMSCHCWSVRSVEYDWSFMAPLPRAPLPRTLMPTCQVNNSPDQILHDDNYFKFIDPSIGQALILQPGLFEKVNDINSLRKRTKLRSFC